MPRVIALLLTAMSMGSAVAASAQERPFEELPVTIKIHDYAHVSNGSLSRATRLASEVYQRIGVRTMWMDTVRFGDKKANAERTTAANQIAQITILVVTQKMASRGQMGPDVLGFAAVPDSRALAAAASQSRLTARQNHPANELIRRLSATRSTDAPSCRRR